MKTSIKSIITEITFAYKNDITNMITQKVPENLSLEKARAWANQYLIDHAQELGYNLASNSRGNASIGKITLLERTYEVEYDPENFVSEIPVERKKRKPRTDET